VQGDLVPGVDDFPAESGRSGQFTAEDEERRAHIEFGQQAEEERRRAGVWAVVEGEGDVPGVTDTRQAREQCGTQGWDEGRRRADVSEPRRGCGADQRPLHPATR
jgi:hypothetical protein